MVNSVSTYQDIDGQLRTAAEAFLENDDACVVDSGKREVRLSQIFKWYKADFGGTDEKVVRPAGELPVDSYCVQETLSYKQNK